MVGIRNGGGVGGVVPNTIPSALSGLRSPLAGLSGVVVGGGPAIRPSSLASPSNANTHLHLTPPQRRTLLLQVNTQFTKALIYVTFLLKTNITQQ